MGKIRILTSAILLYSISSIAFAYSGFLNVKIYGEVLSRPCTINNGNLITIDFKDVVEKDIDKGTYIKPIDYSLNCRGVLNPAMRMSITGIGASFNSEFLKTNFDNLAIEFKYDTSRFPLKNKIKYFYKNPPKLYAVLVKRSSSMIPGGEFTANATLKVEYE